MTPSERAEFEQMKEEIGRLKEAIRFLAFAKTTDQEFAFFDWLVKNDIFDERRTRLDFVLAVLDARAHGEPLLPQRDIPGVSAARLYQTEAPSYDDAVFLLGQASSCPPHIVEALIDAFEQQGVRDWIVALRRAEVDAED